MSEIILVKETFEVKHEVKTVEVPDYQPRFDAIQELKIVATKANAESVRTVEMLGGSVIEQIATYLQEMLAPVLKYYEEHDADISYDIGWSANGWRFETRRERDHKRTDMVQLGGVKDCHYLWISFATDGYHIYDDGVHMELVRDLANRWPDFKKYTQQRIGEVLDKLKYEQEKQIRYDQSVIDALKNFEL